MVVQRRSDLKEPGAASPYLNCPLAQVFHGSPKERCLESQVVLWATLLTKYSCPKRNSTLP